MPAGFAHVGVAQLDELSTEHEERKKMWTYMSTDSSSMTGSFNGETATFSCLSHLQQSALPSYMAHSTISANAVPARTTYSCQQVAHLDASKYQSLLLPCQSVERQQVVDGDVIAAWNAQT
jgi:hypothetical protein